MTRSEVQKERPETTATECLHKARPYIRGLVIFLSYLGCVKEETEDLAIEIPRCLAIET